MCSYCGCESITVVGRFMAEHVEIVNACGDLRRACADGSDVTRAADHLQALLRPHTSAEEVGMFSVLAEEADFTDHVRLLCAEHEGLDEMLADLAAGRTDRMDAFERALRDHIDREENGLFPAAAVAFAGLEWERVDALTPAAVPILRP
ncbi:MAG TPA: hemerythrin domain-containing protein [Phycicoccus sp.]